MAYSTKRGKSGELRVWVNDIESWGGFEEIARFFQGEFDAKIISKVDGPDDTRIWDLAINGQIITLAHDDFMGNSFFSRNPLGEAIVESLARSLQKRIDEMNPRANQ